MKIKLVFIALCISFSMPLTAQHSVDKKSPYAGMQDRSIKSLSEKDIQELKRGGGWGFALPAELNGMPGPLHILELKEKLALSNVQIEQIQSLFEEMKKIAIPLGERLIEAETAIEKAFASGKIEEASLKRLLATSEAVRADLRFVHLSQHYKTVPILNAEQIKAYSVLRGYTDDPCKSVPQGHDPQMYRKHMGCN